MDNFISLLNSTTSRLTSAFSAPAPTSTPPPNYYELIKTNQTLVPQQITLNGTQASDFIETSPPHETQAHIASDSKPIDTNQGSGTALPPAIQPEPEGSGTALPPAIQQESEKESIEDDKKGARKQEDSKASDNKKQNTPLIIGASIGSAIVVGGAAWGARKKFKKEGCYSYRSRS